jgi:hypothetical protein
MVPPGEEHGRTNRGESSRRSPTSGDALRSYAVRALLASVGALIFACASGCLVSFDDEPHGACDGGACPDAAKHRDAAEPEASVCSPGASVNGKPCGPAPDACHGIPTCKDGVCGAPAALADGTSWKVLDPNARCCNGVPIETTDVDNCGACGLRCNTAAGQTCENLTSTEYFCSPCSSGMDCWSGCCSLTLTSHCSPSDCTCIGACQSPDPCNAYGAVCQGGTLDHCSYP